MLDMKKVLIAVDSEIISEDLCDRLNTCFEVQCCHNGTDAICLIKDFRPDVLVIDLMLTELDGISVLKMAKIAGLLPKVIAFIDYTSTYITEMLEQLDVSSLFRHTTDMRAVTARILELSKQDDDITQVDIQSFLAFLGFKMNTSSTNITRIALEQYQRIPKQALSNGLYPIVASLCNGTPMQVEHAIRKAVESAWRECDESVWRLYFAVGKNNKVKKPTNADFLARASRCISSLREGTGQGIGGQKKTG